ncbi:hypothetical protein B0T21DRAFT_353347 [Apiosordaria backusii]|uniref:Uncharacterized protein n=1 Tax=Apiosordaria backusii TaxID=314023 RepID=A0AA39ZSL3_9PEZI|nr:hypothetical protein B0T21DRAFT_353347 [Apiosordaria backusii]
MASTVKSLANCLWEMFMGPGSVPPSDDASSTNSTTVDQSVSSGAGSTYLARDDPSVSTLAKANYEWHAWSNAPTVDPSQLSLSSQESTAGSVFSTSSSMGYLIIDNCSNVDDGFEGCPYNPYDITQDSRYQPNFWEQHCPEPETLFVRRSARTVARGNRSDDRAISPKGTTYFH